MTQTEAILAILQSGRSLTPLEALDEVGCFRLGARVWDLKCAGHDIQSESFELPNGKRVARYWLPQEKGQLSLFQQKGPVGEVHQALSCRQRGNATVSAVRQILA